MTDPNEAADVFTKLAVKLRPDPSRTVLRPFGFTYPEAFANGRPTRSQAVAERLMALDPAYRRHVLMLLRRAMEKRHRRVEDVFLRRFDDVKGELGIEVRDEGDRWLVGAYFSQEYAFESAALFNPSIVAMPDRDNAEGSVRFLLSLRGVGEGHVSSVTFRSGTWDGGQEVVVDPPSGQGVPPRIERQEGGWVRLRSDDSADISETVIFPILPSQAKGVEDLRMVRFTEDDGTQSVIGTYTAFDGITARAELMRGVDARTYEMRPLVGAMAGYKGMALFPRRLNGRFTMLSRQDSESIWLLQSDTLERWEEGVPIMTPRYPWEFVQIGNCGSPIELDEGWLIFTHGVGLVRGYCIGACLLDRHDPKKVLARTVSPLLFPSGEEHGGYVPNVTYSCGALLHQRRVLLPYAVADQHTAFAVASVNDLLGVMR